MQVEVVVVTYDRPDTLRHTLETLVRQKTNFPFQILVVDNHPSSGLTRPIVEQFSQARYLEGPGRVSAGRNAAVRASSADFLLWTNDDVSIPNGWIQGLLDQFTRPDIMVVCSQVLPMSLEHEAEQLWHQFSSFTKGNKRLEYTRRWLWESKFKSPKTHDIGVGNSFAVRAECFKDPRVGLFNEALGAGTPSASADDQYFWYRVLNAGYTVVYEPSIVLCDRYETDVSALYRKLYNYGKAMINTCAKNGGIKR
jgi:GT2 family glycosyltransferase